MGFCGLVPSKHSSGQVTRRGHITKAGNTHLRAQLVESAWAYQHRPGVGATITRRQEVWTPGRGQGLGRAAAVMRPLPAPCVRKTAKNVVVTAIARELAGFLWPR